jgi:hypothetical protein
MREAVTVHLLPALIALALAWLARRYAVEPEAIAHACHATPWEGACAARSVLIQAFATQGLGWLSLAAGALALASRHPAIAARAARLRVRAAQVGLAAGAAGLVLYCFEPSAVGVLLAALAACAPRPDGAAADAAPDAARRGAAA